ncbi:hypothetical protein CLAIMM_14524 [Cladophialophora immunda]|nr:hypothetical protein CLAIMM_14524 [Cladophialophora immunda]
MRLANGRCPWLYQQQYHWEQHHGALNPKPPRPKPAIAVERYFAELPALWAQIKDLYLLARVLRDFNIALKNIMAQIANMIDPEKLVKGWRIYQDTNLSLRDGPLLGFMDAGRALQNTTIDKYPAVVRELAAVEARLRIAMSRLATFEDCVCAGEQSARETLAAVEAAMPADGEEEITPDTFWVVRIQMFHHWVLERRSRARKVLFRGMSKLSTPRLRALDYRRDFFYSLLDENQHHPWLGPPGLSAIVENVAALTLAQPPVDRETNICAICRESLGTDPLKVEDDETKQLLAYMRNCCRQYYHVCCLVDWLDSPTSPVDMSGPCPTCRALLSYDFCKELLEIRVVELGTL